MRVIEVISFKKLIFPNMTRLVTYILNYIILAYHYRSNWQVINSDTLFKFEQAFWFYLNLHNYLTKINWEYKLINFLKSFLFRFYFFENKVKISYQLRTARKYTLELSWFVMVYDFNKRVVCFLLQSFAEIKENTPTTRSSFYHIF